MKKRVFLTAFISLTIFLASCTQANIDTMLDDYYARLIEDGYLKFGDYTGDEILSPGDEGFTEDKMLRDKYVITTDTLLQIAAPYRCTEYEWYLFDAKEGNLKEFYVYGANDLCTRCVTRDFKVYVQNSKLDVGVYYLTLNVKGDDGNFYTDTAKLSVYPYKP